MEKKIFYDPDELKKSYPALMPPHPWPEPPIQKEKEEGERHGENDKMDDDRST